MALADITRRIAKFTADNSPAILTALSAAGVVSTAVLSARAAVQSHKKTEEFETWKLENNRYNDTTTRELLGLNWKYWVPPVLAAGLTITGVVCSNRISSKRAAAMASAYTVVETAFGAYKEEVLEQIGVKGEEKVRDAVAQKRVDREPPTSNQINLVGEGKVPCFETISGKYFESTMELLRSAENDMGYSLIHEGYASLNEWYHLLGLETTSMGDNLGWNVDQKFELSFSATLVENKPIIVVDYKTLPKANFTSFH